MKKKLSFFCKEENKSRSLLIVFVIVINIIVLFNSLLHYPFRGYDAYYHRINIQIYPLSFPTPTESKEFFSAPLPYLIPSIGNKVCLFLGGEIDLCVKLAGKTAQLINFFLSIGITIILWKITDKTNPNDFMVKWMVFLNLGILTVFYKTFSQVRGEPYVAFFIILLTYQLLLALLDFWNETIKLGRAFFIGLSLGLAILSRQWVFFVIPAFLLVFLLVFIFRPSIRKKLWGYLLITSAVTILVGGWFYLYLQLNYGSITAFNLDSPGFSFSNMPNNFYRATGFYKGWLFTNPVRPTFDFTFMPILYSDIWGDYWAYFSMNLDNINAEIMRYYLGFVNLISLIPSFLIAISFFGFIFDFFKSVKARFTTPMSLFKLLLCLIVINTLVGFLWFVISYPEVTNGDTVKATYIIQAIIILPIISGMYFGNLLKNKPRLFTTIVSVYIVIFLISLRAHLTSFILPLF